MNCNLYNSISNTTVTWFLKLEEGRTFMFNQGGNRGLTLIGNFDLKAAHDDRSEFRYVRNPAGNRVSFSYLRAIHDDRRENWYVRGTPLVTGFPFFFLPRFPISKSIKY